MSACRDDYKPGELANLRIQRDRVRARLENAELECSCEACWRKALPSHKADLEYDLRWRPSLMLGMPKHLLLAFASYELAYQMCEEYSSAAIPAAHDVGGGCVAVLLRHALDCIHKQVQLADARLVDSGDGWIWSGKALGLKNRIKKLAMRNGFALMRGAR